MRLLARVGGSGVVWQSCQDVCKLLDQVPDWYGSFKDSRKCACMEDTSEKMIDEHKLPDIWRKPKICSTETNKMSCQFCCMRHLGLIDSRNSFTKENPKVCMCKPNFEQILKPDRISSRIKKDYFKAITRRKKEPIPSKETTNEKRKTQSNHFSCNKAGNMCQFCCRKIQKVINWRRSFQGFNECFCIRKLN